MLDVPLFYPEISSKEEEKVNLQFFFMFALQWLITPAPQAACPLSWNLPGFSSCP